jgi:hypothetical protein
MTWSAWRMTVCGTVRPSAFAVLRLITSSNFVGCSMGRSAGLAPLRILSTSPKARPRTDCSGTTDAEPTRQEDSRAPRAALHRQESRVPGRAASFNFPAASSHFRREAFRAICIISRSAASGSPSTVRPSASPDPARLIGPPCIFRHEPSEQSVNARWLETALYGVTLRHCA